MEVCGLAVSSKAGVHGPKVTAGDSTRVLSGSGSALVVAGSVSCDWWRRSPLVQQQRGHARAHWLGVHTWAGACGVRAKRETLWNITEWRSRASPMGGEVSVHQRAEERAGGV